MVRGSRFRLPFTTAETQEIGLNLALFHLALGVNDASRPNWRQSERNLEPRAGYEILVQLPYSHATRALRIYSTIVRPPGLEPLAENFVDSGNVGQPTVCGV